jgi:cryptochrome
MDAFKKSQAGTKKPFNPQIVVQLLWREFFYTMSVNNQYFGEMDQNKICINIDWYPITDNNNFSAFTQARTGYPLIDAGVRQLLKEGWVHHIIRYVDLIGKYCPHCLSRYLGGKKTSPF